MGNERLDCAGFPEWFENGHFCYPWITAVLGQTFCNMSGFVLMYQGPCPILTGSVLENYFFIK